MVNRLHALYIINNPYLKRDFKPLDYVMALLGETFNLGAVNLDGNYEMEPEKEDLTPKSEQSD